MALVSGNKTLRKWEIKTIRSFILRVSGRLILTSRQLILKTQKDLFHSRLFAEWMALGDVY